jgi:hypothetical protein
MMSMPDMPVENEICQPNATANDATAQACRVGGGSLQTQVARVTRVETL